MIAAYLISQSGAQRIWKEENAHDGAITTICVGHGESSKLLYSGDQQGKIRVWNILTGENMGELTIHNARITAMAVSLDGRYV